MFFLLFFPGGFRSVQDSTYSMGFDEVTCVIWCHCWRNYCVGFHNLLSIFWVSIVFKASLYWLSILLQSYALITLAPCFSEGQMHWIEWSSFMSCDMNVKIFLDFMILWSNFIILDLSLQNYIMRSNDNFLCGKKCKLLSEKNSQLKHSTKDRVGDYYYH